MQRRCQKICDSKGPHSHCIFVDLCWKAVAACEVATIACYAKLYKEPGIQSQHFIVGKCTEGLKKCEITDDDN
ncbi:uncharacterized protein DMAD_11153 [Drosophila madeirensis]|uniref:Uncharacterized protein n=1 Tax=Drosophila madeirensis TaxID=30013 RepID=A0AAU9FC53_DROMD